jgi:hypothetical protein
VGTPGDPLHRSLDDVPGNQREFAISPGEFAISPDEFAISPGEFA